MCGVSRSSFEQRKKAEAEEEKKKAEKKEYEDSLKELMRKIMKALHYVPGERSFKTFLWRDYGVNIGRKLISRLMKEMNIRANVPKKDAYKGMAKHDHPCTKNHCYIIIFLSNSRKNSELLCS
ncbi:MAG: transposase [Solobacterium sp.]|nr:transposase [Solobacterium sp.]